MSSRPSLAVCTLVLALIAGCSEPRPEFVPAEGVVRVNGQPERGLDVRFSPDEANPFKVSATGMTDDQGKFKLTYEYKGETGDGIGVGTYKVTLVDSKVGFTPEGQRPKKPSIPYLYGDVSRSPFTVEIKPGGPPIELDLKK
jgi:hypothetical protein